MKTEEALQPSKRSEPCKHLKVMVHRAKDHTMMMAKYKTHCNIA